MKAPAKLDCLDGMRGLAVLAVILFHHRLECESHVRSAFYGLLAPSRFGFLGVHLFLVLSGFCLTYSLIRRTRAARAPTLRRFLADRWWRIAPPYYVAIALYLLAASLQADLGLPPLRAEPNTIRQVAMHVGFVHGLRGDTIEAINSPFWSLSLEFQFYAVLPLLFALSERLGYRWVIAGVAVLSLAWRAAVLRAMPSQTFLLHGFFLGRWAEFAFGMGVASWYAGRDGRAQATPCVKVNGLLAAGCLLLVIGAGLSSRGAILVVDTTVGAGFALILTATLLSSEAGGRLGQLVASPYLVRIGVISYSLYLTHSLALAWIDRGYARLVSRTSVATEVMLFVVAATLVWSIGWVYFQVVERRFVRSVDATTRGSGAWEPAIVGHAIA
ncbi:MAG: hypothetical protein JWN86_1246 [Planctomycetota bacterium]|nr:hypothetical protein [Planctomycetota bacterium]